jgi:hypothetical protein
MDGWTPRATGPSIAVADQSPASNGTAQDADNRHLPTAYRLPPIWWARGRATLT